MNFIMWLAMIGCLLSFLAPREVQVCDFVVVTLSTSPYSGLRFCSKTAYSVMIFDLHCKYAKYVSGFEKRGNFAHNAKFWHFSSYHHFKAVRASDFILGLGGHQALCFTNPMFEAVDSLLSEVVTVKPKV